MNEIQRDYAYGIIPFYRQSLAEYLFFVGRAEGSDGREVFWKFPKGHKSTTEEDEISTAIRELREETGINLPRAAVIDALSFTEEYFFERGRESEYGAAGIVRKKNTYWLGQVASHGEALPVIKLDDAEFSEYRWARYEEANDLLPENSRTFLKEAHDFLVRNRV